MLKRVTFTIIFLCLILTVNGQNHYSKIIRQAEHKIINKQLDSAIFYYKQAFKKHEYPFTRDVLAAACITTHTNDTNTLYSLLEVLLNRGMSLNELNYFVKKNPDDKRLNLFKNEYLKYNVRYLNSLDSGLYNMYEALDIEEQISNQNRILSISQKLKDLDNISNKYLNLLNKYGFPTENKIGIGCFSAIEYLNKKSEIKKDERLISIKNFKGSKSSKYIFWHRYSNLRFINTQYYRVGNGFLWHTNLALLPKLDSVLLSYVHKNKMSSTFFGSVRERGGWDYGLSWESKANQKYNFSITKIIKSPEANKINLNRMELGLRSLEMDLDLFNAIVKLEKINPKHYFKSNTKKANNLLFLSLFVQMIP